MRHFVFGLLLAMVGGRAAAGSFFSFFLFFFLGFFLVRVTVTGGYDDTARALLSWRGARRAKLRVSLDVGVVIQ